MALLRDGIRAANNCVDQMGSATKELSSVSQDIIDKLSVNQNFQTFKDGTDKGAIIYNDLTKCVHAIVDQLVPTIEKISNTTYNLLNEQENLNRVEENRQDMQNMRY